MAKKPMLGFLLSLIDAPLLLVDKKAICRYYYWRDDQVCQEIIGGCTNKLLVGYMTELDRQRLARRAAILKSLAHPSRLLIIEMLEEEPRCVGELTEAIGADITTVSKHLSVMKRAGLVRDEKHGTYSEYSLVCDCVTHLIDCIEKGMDSRSEKTPSGMTKLRREKACKTTR